MAEGLEGYAGRRAVVTGARGFVGTTLVAQLRQLRAQVTCVVGTGGSLPGAWHDTAAGPLPQVLCVPWHDLTELRSTVARLAAEHVFHLAARTAHSTDLTEISSYMQSNLELTATLLEGACAAHSTLQSFVQLGSAEEYGPQAQCPITEEALPAPRTPYGLSKLAATLLCQAAHAQQGAPTVVLRPFLLYGPGQAGRFFLSQAIEAARTGAPLAMTRGEQARDFLHVDDAVRGLLLAGLAPSLHGQVANLCSGEEHTLEGICRLVENLAHRSHLFDLGALPYRAGECFRLVGSYEKLQHHTGWSPVIALEDGLRQLLSRTGTA